MAITGLAATFLFSGCPATSLKDLVEDMFSDFTGLHTALKRPYIVGLTPDEGFPNLHCCWVGDRTGWQQIAGTWKSEKKTEANGDVLGILKAFTIEVKANATTLIEATAEPFYRDQLINIRHIGQPHCVNHEEVCSKKICTDSLKVGKVTVTVYTEFGGGASVGVAPGETPAVAGLNLVKLDGKTYSKDTLTASDVIVGYKMEKTSCGPGIGTTWFGPNKTPSAALKPGEKYEDHVKTYSKDIEQQNGATHALAPQLPSGSPKILRSEQNQPTALLAPPPDHVLSGEVMRVTTVNASYSPNPSLSGIVVTETDSNGRQQSRTVMTDADGAAIILLAENTAQVAIALKGKQVYTAKTQSAVPLNDNRPAITGITAYQSAARRSMVESGSLVEIHGTDLSNVTQLTVDGRPAPTLASGRDYALGRLEGEGPGQLQVSCINGLTSPPAPIVLVKLTPEQRPPAVLQAGQTAEIVLRASGTTDAVPVELEIRSGSISFLSGGMRQKVMSSAGSQNLVRTSIRATRAGPYELQYKIGDR
ncbi:MAG: hypothetical protein DMG57_35550 [Acidobacteria bacterium]|nr:MAG: hypothetical protein DMG57_35550 [Acidobacteriota bacterium]